jgi:hypothetical protein
LLILDKFAKNEERKQILHSSLFTFHLPQALSLQFARVTTTTSIVVAAIVVAAIVVAVGRSLGALLLVLLRSP